MQELGAASRPAHQPQHALGQPWTPGGALSGASGTWSPGAGPSDAFRVALLAPLQGPAGIWGPSCLASAYLAQREINQSSGIAGRPCALRFMDASAEGNESLEEELRVLVDEGEVDAVVGMCISSVRDSVIQTLDGRLPFIYTCLHEGACYGRSVQAIGETAPEQLPPAIHWLSAQRHVRKWALIGNDYVWPRVSHAIAREAIAREGGQVVAEHFLPFGVEDYERYLHEIRKLGADGVLISLVGQDAVIFNRSFAAAGLASHAVRLSCAIEENQLLAIGADSTDGLFVSLGYFSDLATDANAAFKERYRAMFGLRAPTLNSIGQSIYEGLQCLAAPERAQAAARHRTGGWRGARRPDLARGESGPGKPIYLAEADGHAFRVLARF